MRIETKYVLALAVLTALTACSPKGEELFARAETALAKGDTNAAIIDLKNLIQDEPQNAKARAMLGRAFVESGQVQLAEVEIQKAQDLGAPAELVLVSSCKVMLAKGLNQQVLENCTPGKGSADQARTLQLVTAGALLSLRRSQEAKAAYEAIVKAAPDEVEAWLGLAGATNAVEGTVAARSVLDKAPPGVKEDVRYWLTLAGVNVAANALPEAEAAYQTAVKKTEAADTRGPARLMALGGLAEVQMRQGNLIAARQSAALIEKAAPKNTLATLLRGQIAAASGELEEARSLLEQVVHDSPRNASALILLSSVNIQQGQLDQAEGNLKTVVALDPQNSRAQRMLLEVRSKLGDTPADSLAGMQAALEQNPGDPTMLATAGRLSMATGDRTQALNYLAEAAKATSSNDVEAQLNIANGYLTAGEVDRALDVLNAMPKDSSSSELRNSLLLTTLLRKGDTNRLLTEAAAILAKYGKDSATRNMVGSVYAAAGKSELAREQFSEALKLDPNNVSALTNLARLEFSAGNLDKAESALQKVLAREPKDLIAVMGLALAAQKRNDPAGAEKYLAQAVKDHPESVESHIALARHYLDTKKQDKARAVADAMVAANPRKAEAANARGVLMASMRDLPAAISSFEQARILQPGSLTSIANLARAQMLNKDTTGAMSTLDSALGDNPKSVQLLSLAAALSLQAGNIERTTGYVERLRQAAPGTAATWQIEGDLAMVQRRYADALVAYEKADPDGKNRLVMLARYSAAQRANVAQPEKVLERWVSAHPDDAETIGMLGEGKRAKGDRDGAIRLYEQALAKAPGSPVLNNNLAMIYIEKGDQRALATAEKAYKALPKVPAIQDTYGWALFRAGKSDQAINVLAEAAKGLPSNAEVQYHYAAALAKAGRNDEARAAADKAVAGTLPPSLKADAERLLKELK